MAKRRMISKDIVDTDNFLDMPISSQNLYFHLCVRADDEGFIGKVKTIMRMVSATADDLKILKSKGLIIPFDDGICVVVHWFLHNTIRSDRYSETNYIEEKETLKITQNKIYMLDNSGISLPIIKKIPKSGSHKTLKNKEVTPNGNQMATKWQPNGNHVAPQCSVVKCSVVKVSVVKCNKEKIKEKSAPNEIYGELNNVLLKLNEFNNLVDKYGEAKTKLYVDRLSTYIASTGKRYKSHYATILTWVRKDIPETKINSKYKEVGNVINTDRFKVRQG